MTFQYTTHFEELIKIQEQNDILLIKEFVHKYPVTSKQYIVFRCGYQSESFIEAVLESSPELVLNINSSSRQLNSWDENKCIEQLEKYHEHILEIAQQAVKSPQLLEDLSESSKTKFYEILIKNHLLNQEELINKKEIEFIKKNNDIDSYFSLFGKEYIDIFYNLAPELLTQLFVKPVKMQDPIVSPPLNFIQYIYFLKAQTDVAFATELFLDFKSYILLPVEENTHFFIKKIDILEHYLKRSDKPGTSSWDFFAPLTDCLYMLTESQKSMYVATAFLELYERIPNSTSKSTLHSKHDVMLALSKAPKEIVQYYLENNNYLLSEQVKQDLDKILMYGQLDKELTGSKLIKKLKI